MSLVVEHNYVSGVPQTAVPGFAPRGVGWHWTAGSGGRAGWQATISYFIATRWQVNASYHGGIWHEHNPGACRTFIQWIVPTTRAAHSIAPSQVFQLNPNKNVAVQNGRFTEVRRILDAKASDPNAGCIAIAYAGMPADLERDMTCPEFMADCRNLARQLVAHPTVIDRPHFGHGWIQPISRYEMDVSRDFVALMYQTDPAPENDMPTPPLTYNPELWKAEASGADLREQAHLDAPVIDRIPAGTPIFTVGASADGLWRLAVAQDPERLLWVRKHVLDPATDPAPDPLLYEGIASIVDARLGGRPLPGDGDVTQLQAALDSANRRTATVKESAASFMDKAAVASHDLAKGIEAAAAAIRKA